MANLTHVFWEWFAWDSTHGAFKVFDTEPCDGCGCLIEGPNSANSPEPAQKLKSVGCKEWKGKLPGDGFPDTSLEHVYCDDCYTKYLRKEMGFP